MIERWKLSNRYIDTYTVYVVFFCEIKDCKILNNVCFLPYVEQIILFRADTNEPTYMHF